MRRRSSMGFLSIADISKLWGVSVRSVRNYCAQGRVPGAFIDDGLVEDLERFGEKLERELGEMNGAAS